MVRSLVQHANEKILKCFLATCHTPTASLLMPSSCPLPSYVIPPLTTDHCAGSMDDSVNCVAEDQFSLPGPYAGNAVVVASFCPLRSPRDVILPFRCR